MTTYNKIEIPATDVKVGDRIGVFGRYSDSTIVTSVTDDVIYTSVATFAVPDGMITVERPMPETPKNEWGLSDRTQLKALHDLATEARNMAHRAYEFALANHQEPGDTDAAYQALLMANRVRERIYRGILAIDV